MQRIARYLALAITAAPAAPPVSRGAIGDLYEADFGSGNVFRFTPVGARITFATGLGNPAGVAFDPKGDLFVANNGGGTIVKISPTGSKITFPVMLFRTLPGFPGPAGFSTRYLS